ncbi:GntR family transcriptional regulator [Roseomonas sp. OT10]|uniref:GntR family transcriptional regulator n=1 Tax=Roseomonas cutis TaxID=2897332 RepID=UPI001E3F0A5D|nr:GntR family transcriptional regulator [Roseomonas sp. OT10]UFN47875.1 GntR family transcriptional regulator [Roseomonas sp. OT10]
MSDRSFQAAAPTGLRPDSRPLYAQVETILTNRIAEGEWPPGHALPAEPELAAELGVSHGTVRKALDALERRHLIERRQGKGTFVARQTSERARHHFFPVRALEPGLPPPISRALSLETGEADTAEAKALHLAEGAPVHRLRRLRLQGGRPFMLEENVLPATLFEDFSVPMEREMPDELYVHYQKRHGVTVVRTEEALSARAATAAVAAELGLEEGAPVLVAERHTWDAAGRVVEHRLSWLNTARHRYVLVLD